MIGVLFVIPQGVRFFALTCLLIPCLGATCFSTADLTCPEDKTTYLSRFDAFIDTVKENCEGCYQWEFSRADQYFQLLYCDWYVPFIDSFSPEEQVKITAHSGAYLECLKRCLDNEKEWIEYVDRLFQKRLRLLNADQSTANRLNR